MPSMNVSLTNELMEFVKQRVASGLYNNSSEVIREAIRNLEKNDQLLYELKLDRLKKELQPGIDQAIKGQHEAYSYEALMHDIDIELNENYEKI